MGDSRRQGTQQTKAVGVSAKGVCVGGGGRVGLKHLADVIIWQASRTRLGPLLGDWLNGVPSWVLGLPLEEQTL